MTFLKVITLLCSGGKMHGLHRADFKRLEHSYGPLKIYIIIGYCLKMISS